MNKQEEMLELLGDFLSRAWALSPNEINTFKAIRSLIENMDKKVIVGFRRTEKKIDIPQWPGDGGDNHGLLTILSIEFDFNGEKWNVNNVTGERVIRLFSSIGVEFCEILSELGYEVEAMGEPTVEQIKAWLRSLPGSMSAWSKRDESMARAIRRLIEKVFEWHERLKIECIRRNVHYWDAEVFNVAKEIRDLWKEEK